MPGSSDDRLNARAILKIIKYLRECDANKSPELLNEAEELADRVDKPRGVKKETDEQV